MDLNLVKLMTKYDPFNQLLDVGYYHETRGLFICDAYNQEHITWEYCSICGGRDEYWGVLTGYQFAVKARQRGFSYEYIQDCLNNYWANLEYLRKLHYDV